jgi:hypothetical protein
MTSEITSKLDSLKYRIFGEASSIEEARDHAEQLLIDSQRHDVSQALDYYHNTIINEAIRLVEESQ